MISVLMALFFTPSIEAKIPEKKLEIQGHRGARGVRPENTLPAFEYALEVGVDTLELDLHATKDDHLVVSHDHYINRSICLDSDGNKVTRDIAIRDLTLGQLKKYDCGSLVNPRFPEQKTYPKTSIPTLAEVFQLVQNSKLPRAKKVKFNIETKISEAHPQLSPAPDEFVKMILEVVERFGMKKRVTLQSFDFRTLKAAHARDPQLTLATLFEDRPKESLSKLVLEFKASILSPQHNWLTVEDVKDMHKLGVKVIPWTPNTIEDWKKLIALGVDGIITDNPKQLIDYLKNSPNPQEGK